MNCFCFNQQNKLNDLQKRVQILQQLINKNQKQKEEDTYQLSKQSIPYSYLNQKIQTISFTNLQQNQIKQLQHSVSQFQNQLNNLKIQFYQIHQKTPKWIDLQNLIKTQKLGLSPQYFTEKFYISNIIQTKEDCERLFQLIQSQNIKAKSLKLLFKASQYNFQIKQFHKKCDEIPNTVTLIKTTANKIIGGYTKCKWSSNNSFANDTDCSSFLFSLTNMHKLKNTNSQRAINNYHIYGPRFGINDLYIADKSNTNYESFAKIGQIYKNQQQYSYNSYLSLQKYLGQSDSSFCTQQWQVYEVRS